MTKTAKERNLRFAGRSIESKKEQRKRADTVIAMHSNRIFGRKKEKKRRKKKISHAIHKNRGKQYQWMEISSVQFAWNYGRKEGSRVRMEGTSLKINWDAAWHASDGLISRGFQPEIRPARATRLRPLSLTNARRDWNQRADIVPPLFSFFQLRNREREKWNEKKERKGRWCVN